MNFTCSYCDVVFSTKQNFNTHLKTKKHLKYYNLIENKVKQCKEEINILKSENERLQNENENLKKKSKKVRKSPEKSTSKNDSNSLEPLLLNYQCAECSMTYSTKRGLTKHYDKCLVSKIKELKNEIKILKKENKDSNKEYKKLALISQKGTTNINSNYNLIINQYKNAPNLILPEDLEIDESLDKYIESGNPQGIVNFLDKYYGSHIPPESRSLWCIDPTRCKFVLRHNNEWKIDLDGNKFRELTFYPLQNMFYEKQKKILEPKINNYTINDNQKLLSNVEFLGGFVDKKEQMKILKDFSKKIYFKKENDEVEENKNII